MGAKYVYINNEIYAEADAKIGYSDLAIQRGYGIFDFFKVINGRTIFMEDHFNRFYNSAKEMNLQIPMSRYELRDTIHTLLQKNDMPSSGVKILLTGGYSADGYTLSKPNLIISQYPLNMEEENEFDTGMKLVTYNHQRQLPYIKTIDYLQAVRLHPYMKEHNADDILYHNNGSVTECPRANFFIVRGQKVITAKTNILKGITRDKILGFKIDGLTISEEDFSVEELKTADEAFISSTTKYAYPVSVIDGNMLGNGAIGPVTRKIRTLLFELAAKE